MGSRLTAKHKQYFYNASILFGVFCLVAAPAHFHVEFYRRWRIDDARAFQMALRHATLYFYAFAISTEALFRMEKIRSIATCESRIATLRAAIFVLLFIGTLEYFTASCYQSDSVPLSAFAAAAQIGAALAALLLSSIVHCLVINHEVRSLR